MSSQPDVGCVRLQNFGLRMTSKPRVQCRVLEDRGRTQPTRPQPEDHRIPVSCAECVSSCARLVVRREALAWTAVNGGLSQVGRHDSDVTQKRLATQCTDESGTHRLTRAEPREDTCNICGRVTVTEKLNAANPLLQARRGATVRILPWAQVATTGASPEPSR